MVISHPVLHNKKGLPHYQRRQPIQVNIPVWNLLFKSDFGHFLYCCYKSIDIAANSSNVMVYFFSIIYIWIPFMCLFCEQKWWCMGHNILPKSSVHPISLRIMPKDAFFVKIFFFWLVRIHHMVLEILFFNLKSVDESC